MFRFLHTSDLHIGRRFGNMPEDLRGRLREARHSAIERLAARAREHGAETVLLAGDTFDTETPAPSMLRQALAAMKQHADLRWVVLPGNHDSLLAEELWARARSALPENVLLATTPEPIALRPDVALLPAPCTTRRPGRDLTEWMDAAEVADGVLRIGLAHGAIQSFSEEGAASDVIAPDRAERSGLDYLALGDWHGQIRVNERTWYAGTPEPDRFKHNAPGQALVVSIGGRGAAPEVTPVGTGLFEWKTVELAFVAGDDPAAALEAHLPPAPARRQTLLRLVTSGRLGMAERLALTNGFDAFVPEFGHARPAVFLLRGDAAMKLTALRLHNVRRFGGRGIAIENIGDGVNVLSAANEYGKSTCFDALHALFFQPHTGTPGAVRSLQPYSGGSPLIEADIATADGRFRLVKQFYGGRRASVVDIGSGRLVAQADEAEHFIGNLVRGGTAGPAGLLWVRQGNTGLEKRLKADEENEKRARETVLSSVQGEVEALTGGRRMVEVMAACEEELSRFVTPTGRPKAGGVYAEAIGRRDRLAEEERRLDADVRELRDALDARRKARTRLAELEDVEEAAARRQRAAEAEAALQAARSHRDALKSAEAEAALLRSRRDAAAGELNAYRALLARAKELGGRQAEALQRRNEAHERQGSARHQAQDASKAVEAAEQKEREARELLARLEKAMRAKEAAERKGILREKLDGAEAAREAIETGEAALKPLSVPAKLLRELEAVETRLFGLRAAAAARAPSVMVHYAPGSADSLLLDGKAMEEGREYAVNATMVLDAADLGTITFAPGSPDAAADGLSEVEEQRRKLLDKLGVTTLEEARSRDDAARRKHNEIELAKQRLALLAPDGIDALRDALARAEAEGAGDLELKGDPEQARAALEAAASRVSDTRNRRRECEPVAEQAHQVMVEAEKALAAVTGDLQRVDGELGPEAGRSEREQGLARSLSEAEAVLAPAEQRTDGLRRSAPDLSMVEAAALRARSVLDAAVKEAAKLREDIADLNGRISARSEDAVEEALRETAEAHAGECAAVERLEREVAVLQRLRGALETARADARDHYFEPVLRELRPLMGLLFDDAAVVFDDGTLLPLTVRRDGQVEDVDRLSGGMREQLAVLTRLAFARLLAREGRPTPVILDDALVYSDDDRIEKMFDALHRQGRDQQILVFSCRQRAFASLGGNMLDMTTWQPHG